MHETYGEHSYSMRLILYHPFHPVVVVRVFIGDDNDFPLLERQLVVVVRWAVVQGPAPAQAAPVGRVRLPAGHGARGRERSRRHRTRHHSVRRGVGSLDFKHLCHCCRYLTLQNAKLSLIFLVLLSYTQKLDLYATV